MKIRFEFMPTMSMHKEVQQQMQKQVDTLRQQLFQSTMQQREKEFTTMLQENNPYKHLQPYSGLFGAYMSSQGFTSPTSSLYGDLYSNQLQSRINSGYMDYDKYIRNLSQLIFKQMSKDFNVFEAWRKQMEVGL